MQISRLSDREDEREQIINSTYRGIIMDPTQNYIETLQYESIEILSEGAIIDKVKKIYEHVKDRIKSATSQFKKYGVSLASLTRKGVSKFKSKLWKLYDSGKAPKDAAKQILKDMVAWIIPFFKPMYEKFQSMGKTQKLILKLLVAAMAVALVVILNTSLAALFARMGMSSIDALMTVAIAVGPPLEEALKTFFLGLGIPWVGTVLFNIVEFAVYMRMMFKGGGAGVGIVVSRLVTAIMHMLFMYTQKATYDEEKEKGKTDKKALFKAWVTATILHSAMNAGTFIVSYKVYQGLLDPTSVHWWVNLVTGKPVSFGL